VGITIHHNLALGFNWWGYTPLGSFRKLYAKNRSISQLKPLFHYVCPCHLLSVVSRWVEPSKKIGIKLKKIETNRNKSKQNENNMANGFNWWVHTPLGSVLSAWCTRRAIFFGVASHYRYKRDLHRKTRGTPPRDLVYGTVHGENCSQRIL